MICPVCRLEMPAFEWQGIEIDVCFDCGGIWLDEGELEALAGRGGAELLAESRPVRRGPRRRCLRCGRRMRRFRLGGEPGIVIDRCRCGIWFDHGELEQLLDSRPDDSGVARLRDHLTHLLPKRKPPCGS